jgi:hypothetical protein
MKEDLDGKIHLETFVKSFIAKDRQERWLYYLLEKPEKIMDLTMSRFYGHRNEKTTEYIKREDFSKFFGNDFDKVKGVYFDEFERIAEFTTLTEAIEKGYGMEAIFSAKAGELALFFTHEYEFFLCKK